MTRIAILAAALCAAPAFAADPICGPYRAIVADLADRWQETVTARGLTGDGQMLVILSDPEGDTWTALILSPDETACLAAAGTAWEALPPKAPGVEG